MQRLVLGIEYDGSDFLGWQTQPYGPTLQARVEAALSQVAAHPVQVQCAGRTDAGVHALEQVAHFDTTASRPPAAWVQGVNTYLPPQIRVLWALPVAPEFHARFSAQARAYRYLIANTPVRPALHYRRAAWHPWPLDVPAMQQAALALVGEHDFSAFRAVGCQARSPVRQMHTVRLSVQAGGYLALELKANGFLHHMVRNIVGVLLAIGAGKRPVGWVEHLLAVRDRRQGGVTAPPQGLYFLGVYYPACFNLPAGQHVQGFDAHPH